MSRTAILMMISTTLYTGACVEQFNFDVSHESPLLVVEGFVSDLSYDDIQNYPVDARYFEVKLKITSGVKNKHDEPVAGAEIQVIDDLAESWEYTEVEPGIYRLFFEDFKAEAGRSYMLNLELSNGDRYESNFEMPPPNQELADFFFEEEVITGYDIKAGEVVITPLKGITYKAKVADLGTQTDFVRYRWDFTTTYGVIAWGLDEDDINYKCWITTGFFFKNFVIAKDLEGGSTHDLFFLETNDQHLHEGFTVSFRQTALTADFYQFWEDVESQEKQEQLFAPPPYNIVSNMRAVGHDKPVYGYFGVVSEKFHRWYFSKKEISYYIDYPESLQRCGVPPAPECFDCRLISRPINSIITNTAPTWWAE
ncbi:MAG: DUF4249 domain-containing protein [Reichenbachiella sp.]|uniref:DUF4249 domain-containing protein n=1 Tax=Reichenbachiella sp. TaxID=2184521 RepID=UPI003265F7B9